MTSNDNLHSELNTHTGKLVTETAGDVRETYHQSCQYQHEQETLTELEIQKELDMLPSQTAYPAGFETSTPD